MATRRYGIGVGDEQDEVTEAAGAAVSSDPVEITVELAATTVGDGAGTRQISKNEVLMAIMRVHDYILKGNWPPA
jgi:hypothetical protein